MLGGCFRTHDTECGPLNGLRSKGFSSTIIFCLQSMSMAVVRAGRRMSADRSSLEDCGNRMVAFGEVD